MNFRVYVYLFGYAIKFVCFLPAIYYLNIYPLLFTHRQGNSATSVPKCLEFSNGARTLKKELFTIAQ